MIIRFNESKGKTQGKIIDIEADSFEDAIKKFGADDVIEYGRKFKHMYFFDVYEVYEAGHPEKVEYFVHKAKEVSE